MNILMGAWNIISDFFVVYIGFFLAPLKNLDMLWIIIPIYLNWIFTEIFQEKKETSLGNAISNGTVALWAGIDGLRYTVKLILERQIAVDTVFIIKILIAVAVLGYGFFIIIQGIRVRKITHYIGRIREVTYILLIATPIFYNVIQITLKNFIIFIIGFPIFYFFVELIDRMTPNPKTYGEDEGVKGGENLPFDKNEDYNLGGGTFDQNMEQPQFSSNNTFKGPGFQDYSMNRYPIGSDKSRIRKF